MRNQPEQQAPPVQRLRIQYAKRGPLRFASHRDFSRAFERAVVRARVPMAYSSGFNPHPRISYAGAAPTGAASEAEYLEIALAERTDPGWVGEVLATALPDGLDVVRVVESPGGALADQLTGSRWRLDLDCSPQESAAAADQFLAAETVLVQRMTKKGMREFDARVAVMSLTVAAWPGGSTLDLLLRHTEPAVRPDDVLAALSRVAGLTPSAPPLLTRLEQGLLGADGLQDPLA
ncbi:MAG: TIGR03936 family radical SAM-associated protein [Nocardioides sp.]|uniref:TIGR03936 family radical SAM-associated protein n=1 Tax=Nocardioides sp. TaxID=35761 RepID=UPI0039E61226